MNHQIPPETGHLSDFTYFDHDPITTDLEQELRKAVFQNPLVNSWKYCRTPRLSANGRSTAPVTRPTMPRMLASSSEMTRA